MRYELVADHPDEAHVLAANPAARTLFDPFLPVLQARALMAAVRLGIFAAIGHETRTADELAAALSLDADTLALHLRVLACAGYLVNEGKTFGLTELAKVSVHPASQHRLSAWIEHNYVHWQTVDRLEEVLQTGRGVNAHDSLQGETEWAAYQEAMLETARPAAGWVAAQVPVPAGATRLLDIGGSHGLYGAAICRAHPPLQAEVLELPAAVNPARRLAQKEGIADVVSHRAGDALTTDLGQESVDVVFLGNLVHHFSVTENQALFSRLATALRKPGVVVIWDFELPAPGSPLDLVADGLALLFRLGSLTRCYRATELITWLEAAGFQDLDTHPSPAPAHMLITGQVM